MGRSDDAMAAASSLVRTNPGNAFPTRRDVIKASTRLAAARVGRSTVGRKVECPRKGHISPGFALNLINDLSELEREIQRSSFRAYCR